MEVSETLKKIATLGLPLLGAALPLPGGASLGTALARYINSPSDNPEDILATLTTSAEALQKAREFEYRHEETLLTVTTNHALAMYQAEVADRNGARQREAAVKDKTPTVLAYLIIGGSVVMVAGTLLGATKVDSVLAGTLIGYVISEAKQVLSYYFGSSQGSERKTELLAQAPAVGSVK